MIKKKICMLGAFSVGKTSLVEKYVHSIFSNEYLSTVGLKISEKVVSIDEQEVKLMLWDMEGKDIYSAINQSYLRGAMGCLIVADGLRLETLTVALEIHKSIREMHPNIPCYLLLNKADLKDQWEISDQTIKELSGQELNVFCTSAKTNLNLDLVFESMARETARG